MITVCVPVVCGGKKDICRYGRKIQFCSNNEPSPGVWVIEQNLEEPEQIFCQ
jgi:hypothetical protein